MSDDPDGGDPDGGDPDGGEPDGGDPVCWLDRLCSECGAMPTDGEPTRCWRCGASVVPAGETT